jgi:hypothetical protein
MPNQVLKDVEESHVEKVAILCEATRE